MLGMTGGIKLETADIADAADFLRGQNPLGKIPALILPSGQVIYDSRVILEALDLYAGGGKILPSEREPRIARLTLQALADGLTDAAILQVYEKRMRPPEIHSERWLEHQKGKVERALRELERGAFDPEPLDVGSIALSCALGYLDLRFAGAWRVSHPRLVAWLEGFAARVPAFEATREAA